MRLPPNHLFYARAVHLRRPPGRSQAARTSCPLGMRSVPSSSLLSVPLPDMLKLTVCEHSHFEPIAEWCHDSLDAIILHTSGHFAPTRGDKTFDGAAICGMKRETWGLIPPFPFPPIISERAPVSHDVGNKHLKTKTPIPSLLQGA